MIKDAVRSLREPLAWILVSAVFLEFVVGLWRLLDKPESEYQQENWFLYNSYHGTSYFVGISVAVMLVMAAVLVTVVPDRLPRTKPILLVVAIETGVLLFFGILTLFLGLFYQAESSVSGASYGPSGTDKAQNFIGSMPELALTLVPLLLALAMLRAPELSSAPPPAVPPMPGQQFAPGAPQQPYPGQPYPGQEGFPPSQQGYPGSPYPGWGPPMQHGDYGQGWQ